MTAARRQVFGVVAQMEQRVERRIRDYPNIAAAPAITARWTTTRHKLLPPKSSYAISPVATSNMNLDAINKHLKLKDARRKVSRLGSGVAL